jgi:hypothetical protein
MGHDEKTLRRYFDFRSAFVPVLGYAHSGEPEVRLNLEGALCSDARLEDAELFDAYGSFFSWVRDDRLDRPLDGI